MRITAKGEYALRIMLYLAESNEERLVKLSEISEREGISLAYLHQLVRNLKKDKLIKSTRGPSGGYALNKPASEISVLQILASTKEDLKSFEMSAKNSSEVGKKLNRLFLEVDNTVWLLLDVKLSHLVENDE